MDKACSITFLGVIQTLVFFLGKFVFVFVIIGGQWFLPTVHH